MSDIIVRKLPPEVHAAIKQAAAARGVSMESLVRTVLSEQFGATASGQGFAEVQAALLPPLAPAGDMPDLFGAMKGWVQPATGTDLTAPLAEMWEAEG